MGDISAFLKGLRSSTEAEAPDIGQFEWELVRQVYIETASVKLCTRHTEQPAVSIGDIRKALRGTKNSTPVLVPDRYKPGWDNLRDILREGDRIRFDVEK